MSLTNIYSGDRRAGWKRPRRWAPAGRGDYCLLTTWFRIRLVYLWRSGYRAVAVGRRGGVSFPVSLAMPLEVRDVKRKNVGGSAGSSFFPHLAPVETELFTKLMALVGHMGVTRYDDGEPRKPGWVTISTMGSSWKVVCKDPDSCAQMTALGTTLDDALTLADLLLSSEEAPWEPDAFLAKTKKK